MTIKRYPIAGGSSTGGGTIAGASDFDGTGAAVGQYVAVTQVDGGAATGFGLLDPVRLDPVSYGAVGDGVTDDTIALRACLADLDARGSGLMDLGGRTYLTGKLSLKPQLGIVNGTFKLAPGTNDYMLALEGHATRGQHSWLVDRVVFDGNKTNNASMPGVIHSYAGSGVFERPLISRCRISNAKGNIIHFGADYPNALYIQPRVFMVTIDCSETAAGTTGLTIDSGVSDSLVVCVDIGRCHTGLLVSGASKQRFTEVRTWGNADAGTKLVSASSLTFVNCEIDNNLGHGLFAQSATNVHFLGSAFTNSAYVDTDNSFGYGAGYNAAAANTKDGAYLVGSDVFFTGCRFGNEEATTGAYGEQRFGVVVDGDAYAVLAPDCTFRNHRTGDTNAAGGIVYSGRNASSMEFTNGAHFSPETPTRADVGFYSSLGAGMEIYKASDGGRPGRLTFIAGGAAGVGDVVFVHSDGVGGFADLAAVLAGGGVRIANSQVPATPSDAGVLYVESGALKYKGSAGTVTTLGLA